MKSVRIRSFSSPYFPTFGLNTERYSISLRIQSECRKIRIRKNSVSGQFSRSVREWFDHSQIFNFEPVKWRYPAVIATIASGTIASLPSRHSYLLQIEKSIIVNNFFSLPEPGNSSDSSQLILSCWYCFYLFNEINALNLSPFLK